MTKKTPSKQTKQLRRIGLWATIWWAVSCLYPLLLVVQATGLYVDEANAHPGGGWADWTWAVGQTYEDYAPWQWLLLTIVLVWLIGGIMWLRAVRASGISYGAAFKDLFLTIRK